MKHVKIMYWFCFCLSILFLPSCTTLKKINENYANVRFTDGIHVKEAVYIAQNYCVGDLNCYKKVRISSPDVKEDENSWYVMFWSKNLSNLGRVYVIEVDRMDGQVLSTELSKK